MMHETDEEYECYTGCFLCPYQLSAIENKRANMENHNYILLCMINNY